MKVSMNYTTRKMIILDQIRGFNEENLVDDIEITVPAELSGFNIAIVFAQGDDTPIGATTLELGWTSGVLIYSVPAQLTTFNHIKFQILAAHPTTQAIWKSQIGHIYFEEPLPYIGDIPFTELSPYPDWLLAIEAANAAANTALEAAGLTQAAIDDAVEATNYILNLGENFSESEAIRETNEQERIANELERQEFFHEITSNNGILVGDGLGNVTAIPLNTYALKEYVHYQMSAQKTWYVIHNKNTYPSVTIIDSTDTVVFGDIEYIDVNNLKITFSAAFSGKAYII